MTKINKKLLLISIIMLSCLMFLMFGFIFTNKSSVNTLVNAEGNSAFLYWKSQDWQNLSEQNINYINNLVITTDNAKLPYQYLYSFDVSQEQDGSLNAYFVEDENFNINCVIYGDVDTIYLSSDNKYIINTGNCTINNLYIDNLDLSNCIDIKSGGYSIKQGMYFNNINTNAITDMSYLFSNCINLENLSLAGFNTSNVTNMSGMFSGCESIQYLDVSSFNTLNVTDMSYMFELCNMSSLDLSNFKTNNLENICYMFTYCQLLEDLNISSFDTSNVVNMMGLFSNCINLSNLNLSNFDTGNTEFMREMFFCCTNLSSLNLSSFDTSKVIDMMSMFDSCESLKSLDLSSFNTVNTSSMIFMFYGCSQLEILDVSSFVISSETETDSMFDGCDNLKYLYAPIQCDKTIPLPVTMYIEETNIEITELSSDTNGKVLCFQPNIQAPAKGGGNNQNPNDDLDDEPVIPNTGFDIKDIAITTTLGTLLLTVLAVAFVGSKKRYIKKQ